MATRFGNCNFKTVLSQLRSSVHLLGGSGAPHGRTCLGWNGKSLLLDPTSRKLHASLALEATHQINMPSLSPTMTEGTIVKWMKKEGEPISAGDVLCDIQTDKAVMSLECDDDGIMAKIMMPDNSVDIKVGTLIALTVDEGDDWKAVEVPSGAATSAAPKTASSPPPAASQPATATPEAATGGKPGLLGPAVKNYLHKFGLSTSQVDGTGPHGGIIMKGDVLAHALANKSQPVAQGGDVKSAAPKPAVKKAKDGGPGQFVDIPVSSMRKVIATRLLQSKSRIPHAYGTAECDVGQMTNLRKRLAGHGVKVSVNDVIIKCVGVALARVPALNCIWEKDQLIQKGPVDISVAVATPNGLITPIVFNVGSKDVTEISEVVKVLAGKAKDGKLQPNEFMGGTFTISNLGMFGIHSFTAIINPPQCAILAVGGNIVAIDESGNPKTTTKLQLSYDARAIGEEDVGKFLAILKTEIENVSEISMGFSDLRARNWA